MPLPIIDPIIECEALEGSLTIQVKTFHTRLPTKAAATKAVSYTHLDVYKRQLPCYAGNLNLSNCRHDGRRMAAVRYHPYNDLLLSLIHIFVLWG